MIYKTENRGWNGYSAMSDILYPAKHQGLISGGCILGQFDVRYIPSF